MRPDISPASHIDQHDNQEQHEAEDDNHHLHKVGDSDGPHAARNGVYKDNDGATHDADMQRHAGQRFENVTEGHQQATRPADIGRDRGDCRYRG